MNNTTRTYRLSYFAIIAIVWHLCFVGICLFVWSALGLFEPINQVDKFAFNNPTSLFLGLLHIPLFILYYLKLKRINKIRAEYGDSWFGNTRTWSAGKSLSRYLLLSTALSFIIIALGRPVFGSEKTEGYFNSMELIVCLDISNSMNCRDISKSESRLEISKKALKQLINSMNGEKIGICVFANEAFVQLPLTRDYNAAKMFVDEIQTSLISNQGTDIAEAFEVSKKMFSEDLVHRGILLVTDGENHEGNLDDVIDELREEQIVINVLGIGTTKGGLVPKNPTNPERGYKKDKNGNSVLSKLNVKMIHEIANKTGGKAYIESKSFPDLSGMMADLKEAGKNNRNKFTMNVRADRYQFPLVFALICWFAYLFTYKENFTLFKSS